MDTLHVSHVQRTSNSTTSEWSENIGSVVPKPTNLAKPATQRLVALHANRTQEKVRLDPDSCPQTVTGDRLFQIRNQTKRSKFACGRGNSAPPPRPGHLARPCRDPRLAVDTEAERLSSRTHSLREPLPVDDRGPRTPGHRDGTHSRRGRSTRTFTETPL